MKIKLSKAQWSKIGKTAGWLPEQDENRATEDALRNERTQSPVAKDIRKDLNIDSDDEVSRRRSVKVTFSDGDTISTWINGTKKEIIKYYLPYGDRGPDQDYDNAHPEKVRHAVGVEFLD